MYALGILLITIANILDIVLGLYQFIVIAAVILSWIQPNPANEFIRMLLMTIARLTNPVFSLVRLRMPRAFMSTGLDFSPLIVLVAIFAVKYFLVNVIHHYGVKLAYGLG